MPSEATPLNTKARLSSSLLEANVFPLTPLDPFVRASWHIEDAAQNRPPNNYASATVLHREQYLLAERLRYPWRGLAILALIVLTYFELPLWCLGVNRDASTHPWSFEHARCTAIDHGHIYLFGTPFLPVGWSCIIEILIYLFLLNAGRVESSWRGRRSFIYSFRGVRFFVSFVALVDTIVFLAIRQSSFRLAPYCRLFYLASLPTLREAVLSAFEILPAYFGVVAILAMAYLLQAWVMVMLLDDVEDKVPGCAARAEQQDNVTASLDECDDVNKGFDTLQNAIWTMMVDATNTDVPDQMVPNYAHSRAYAPIWLVSYVLINFVLLSFTLAIVYSEYQDSLKRRLLARFKMRATNLRKAYYVLAQSNRNGKKGISLATMVQLIKQLNTISIVPFVPEDHTIYLFNVLDDDKSGFVTLDEFYDFMDTITIGFKNVRNQPYVEYALPNLWRTIRGYRLRAAVCSNAWTWFWNVLLVINTICIFVESAQDLANLEDDPAWPSPSFWAWIQFTFSMAYLFQLGLILLTQPFGEWWAAPRHKYDFVVTIMLVFVSILWVLPQVHIEGIVLRIFNILRVLRLLVVLMKIDKVAFVVKSLSTIMGGSISVIGLLFLLVYLWSVMGVQMYGGLIYSGNAALTDSDMIDGNYDVLNFNDMLSAVMPLMAMLVTGGWTTQVVTGLGLVSWGGLVGSTIFVGGFYYLGVLVAFNVFVSFIIDALTNENLAAAEDSEKNENLASFFTYIKEHPLAGYTVVVKTKGGQDAMYKTLFADELKDVLNPLEEPSSP